MSNNIDIKLRLLIKDFIKELKTAGVNTAGLEKGLEEVEKQSKKTGKTGKKSFTEWNQGIEITRKLIGAIKKALDFSLELKNASRDAEETNSKFDQVFISIKEKANIMAQGLAEDFGLADTTAKKMLSTTGDLLVGFGFTEDKAFDLSKQVFELGNDLASFSNLEGGAERATEALTKALLGETESAKALGISIQQGTKEFKDRVKVLQETNDVSLMQAKAMTIMEIAQKQSTKAQGDYKRTQESLANVERRRIEMQKELYETLGNRLVPLFKSWNNIAMAFIELALPDEFKDVSENVKNSHLAVKKLREELSGLTKEQIERKLKEVQAELKAISESSKDYAQNLISQTESQEENSKVTLAGKAVFDKYATAQKDNISLTSINTTETDAFSGSNKLLNKQLDATGKSTFKYVSELEALIEQMESLIDTQTNVATSEEVAQARREEINKLLDETVLKFEKLKATQEDYESGLPDDMQRALDKKEAYEMELAFFNEMLDLKLISEEAYEEQLKELREKYDQEEEEEEEEKKEASLEDFAEKIEIVGKYYSVVSDIASNFSQIELNNLKKKYKEEKKLLDKNLKDGIISKTEYDKQLAILDNKRAEEERAIKEQKKKWEIGEAIINTAAAVVEALPNIPLSILMGVLGGVQIAKISSQTFARGGMIGGSSHDQGGIALIDNKTGQHLGEIEGGEGIVNKEAMRNPYARAKVSEINQSFGNGVAFPNTSRMFARGGMSPRRYQTGGIAPQSPSRTYGDTSMIEELKAIREAIQEIPAPVIEINNDSDIATLTTSIMETIGDLSRNNVDTDEILQIGKRGG